MRLQNLIISIIFIIILTSCQKDNDSVANELSGLWTLTVNERDGIEQWNQDVTVQLEFFNIENGSGEVREHYYYVGSQGLHEGTFSANEDFSKITVHMNTPNNGTEHWDVDVNIVNSKLILDGYNFVSMPQFNFSYNYQIRKEGVK